MNICKYCNKDGLIEETVECATCKGHCHPTCLDLPLHIVPQVKKYDWQCNDCKFCYKCQLINHEKKILFCDLCDRGYHMYCLVPKLMKKPKGDWYCPFCFPTQLSKKRKRSDSTEDVDTESTISTVTETNLRKARSSLKLKCQFPGCDGNGSVRPTGSSHTSLSYCPLNKKEKKKKKILLIEEPCVNKDDNLTEILLQPDVNQLPTHAAVQLEVIKREYDHADVLLEPDVNQLPAHAAIQPEIINREYDHADVLLEPDVNQLPTHAALQLEVIKREYDHADVHVLLEPDVNQLPTHAALQLEVIKREYDNDELTLKGYTIRRCKVLEPFMLTEPKLEALPLSVQNEYKSLEMELEEEDITEKGFKKKRANLLKPHLIPVCSMQNQDAVAEHVKSALSTIVGQLPVPPSPPMLNNVLQNENQIVQQEHSTSNSNTITSQVKRKVKRKKPKVIGAHLPVTVHMSHVQNTSFSCPFCNSTNTKVIGSSHTKCISCNRQYVAVTIKPKEVLSLAAFHGNAQQRETNEAQTTNGSPKPSEKRTSTNKICRKSKKKKAVEMVDLVSSDEEEKASNKLKISPLNKTPAPADDQIGILTFDKSKGKFTCNKAMFGDKSKGKFTCNKAMFGDQDIHYYLHE